MKICIQNLGMYTEGTLLWHWLELPATDEEIQEALDKIRVCNDKNKYYNVGIAGMYLFIKLKIIKRLAAIRSRSFFMRNFSKHFFTFLEYSEVFSSFRYVSFVFVAIRGFCRL